MVDKTQVRLGSLQGPIAARTDASSTAAQTIRRDLERYYALMAHGLASVALTADEAGLIVDVLNGTVIGVEAAQLLAAEVEDAIALDGVADKWRVDGPALVALINGWTLAQRLAVLDAVERFWVVGNHVGNHVGNTADRLVAVGLVRRA